MAAEENGPAEDSVSEIGHLAEQRVTGSTGWMKKKTAETVLKAYGQAAILAVGMTVLPLPGGPPTISQETARKPDEHIASQPEASTVTLEEPDSAVVSVTTSTAADMILRPL
jgi:hypothetical protein